MSIFNHKKKIASYEPITVLTAVKPVSEAEIDCIATLRANYTKLANEIKSRAVVFEQMTRYLPDCISTQEQKYLRETSAQLLKTINKLFMQRVK